MPSLFDLVPRKHLAAQLRRPSGIVGRLLVAPMLDRMNSVLNDAVLRSLDLDSPDRVLEVGFGGGSLLSRILPCIPEGHLVGVDFSQDMVDLGAGRFSSAIGDGMLELVCASVEELPLAENSVDKACTVNTIYFWDDPAPAAAELHRVIAPGGRLVIGYSPRQVLEDQWLPAHRFAMYEPDEVSALLREAGFDDVDVEAIEYPASIEYCTTALKAS